MAPGSPNLYDLTVELSRNGAAFDRYTLPVGIRTVAVAGDQLLFNGQPVYLMCLVPASEVHAITRLSPSTLTLPGNLP